LIQPSAESAEGGIKIPKAPPKYLRVVVDAEHSWDNEQGVGRDKGPVHVNVRVPVALIRAGVKLASLIPPEAYNQMDEKLKDRGIMFDLRNMKPENIDELVQALHELEVDIRGTEEKVRVYTE
jgi:predicted TIM-barrel fold metal-dependent hydrolase